MKLIGIRFNKRFGKGNTIWIGLLPVINIVIHNIYEDETAVEIHFGWINFKFGWLFRFAKKVEP